VSTPGPWTPEKAAEVVTAAYRNQVKSVLAVAAALAEAKERTAHGDWGKVVALLPFGERTAERYLAISKNATLTNPTHVSVLPHAMSTLAELARLPDDVLADFIELGAVTPRMERSDAANLVLDHELDLGNCPCHRCQSPFKIKLNPGWKPEQAPPPPPPTPPPPVVPADKPAQAGGETRTIYEIRCDLQQVAATLRRITAWAAPLSPAARDKVAGDAQEVYGLAVLLAYPGEEEQAS
jgi:hypothetical protein